MRRALVLGTVSVTGAVAVVSVKDARCWEHLVDRVFQNQFGGTVPVQSAGRPTTMEVKAVSMTPLGFSITYQNILTWLCAVVCQYYPVKLGCSPGAQGIDPQPYR